MAIRPNKNWIATKVYVQPYAQAAADCDPSHCFLRVLAPVLHRPERFSLNTPRDPIDPQGGRNAHLGI
jgi:hypothetical protein